MSEYEWDRSTMAVVACALAGDSDGAVALLQPLPQRDVCRIAVRLAAMAADALISAAEDTGGSRTEALARWQQCILQHEVEHTSGNELGDGFGDGLGGGGLEGGGRGGGGRGAASAMGSVEGLR